MRDRFAQQGRLHMGVPVLVMISTAFLTTLVTSLICNTSLVFSSTNSTFRATQNTLTNPTSIPWIDNESRCHNSDRIWRDGKCWDYEHNPMF